MVYFLTVPPKTNTQPDPILQDIDDREMLRNIAFQIEDTLGSADDASFSRAFFIMVRSALLDYADLMERIQ